MSRPICWKSNVEHAAESHGRGSAEYLAALDQTSTCGLPKGHPGPHQWTPDDQFVFVPNRRTGGMDIMKYGRKIGELS